MKQFIIGLGNPGEDYQNTRHNVGFLFIDFVIGTNPDIISTEKKFKDSLIFAYSENIILMKPLTFMNNSGKMVKELVNWFDVRISEELIIVHDDLDIALGSYKFQSAKSPRDHNGITSIENHLGTDDFHRLRIGIENRNKQKIPGEKYVLDKFRGGEMEILETVFTEVSEKNVLKLPDL